VRSLLAWDLLTVRDNRYSCKPWLPLLCCICTAPLYASEIDSAALQKDSATVLAQAGQVSMEKDGQDWAVGQHDRIPVTTPLVTGTDGYARLQVAGGTSFEVFAHSRVIFRRNPGNPQDLLDMETGRARIQIVLSTAQPLQNRVVTPAAIILCRGSASFSIAVDDEDNSTRIDVQQGEVLVQHALLPRTEPVLVKAGDAISVQADQPLVLRRLDRGFLYHLSFQRVWKTLGSAVPGHRGDKDDSSSAEFVALNRNRFCDEPRR
jgi:hypothetical protein